MTPSNPQWILPIPSSSLSDKVNLQFCVYYYEPPKQSLSHLNGVDLTMNQKSASFQASKHKWGTAYNPGTRKAEVLNSLIINTTAKANDTTDILQTFR